MVWIVNWKWSEWNSASETDRDWTRRRSIFVSSMQHEPWAWIFHFSLWFIGTRDFFFFPMPCIERIWNALYVVHFIARNFMCRDFFDRHFYHWYFYNSIGKLKYAITPFTLEFWLVLSAMMVVLVVLLPLAKPKLNKNPCHWGSHMIFDLVLTLPNCS